jgi:hypothetical protein
MNLQTGPVNEKKISLMVVGAQKAGTTSIKNYLGQHPQFQTHLHKEFSYFFDNEEYGKGYAVALRKYFSESAPETRLVAKNAGLYVNENGLKRLRDHNPDCQLILLLRNPVDRTYSSFLMEKNNGLIAESFDSILPIIEKQDISDWRYEFFIGMSQYNIQLEKIYRHFSPVQVKLITYENFRHDAISVCREIFKWAGAREFCPDTSVHYNTTHVTRSQSYSKLLTGFLRNSNPVKKVLRKALPGKMDYHFGEMLRNLNKSSQKYEPMPMHIRKQLIAYYAPFNEKLSQMTGMDFSSWNEIKVMA